MNILIFETKISLIAGDRIIPIDSNLVSIDGDVYWKADPKDSYHTSLPDVSSKVLLNETYFKRIY